MKIDIGAWLLLFLFVFGWYLAMGPTGFMIALTALSFGRLLVALAQDLLNGYAAVAAIGDATEDSKEGGE